MATASDIIDALGGTSAVARELELPPSTVSSWKSGTGIPKWRMHGIRTLAERLGVDLNSLDAKVRLAREAVHAPADTATPPPASSGKGDDLTAAQRSEAA